jgi:HSP20 family protein
MYSLVDWHKREIDNIRKDMDEALTRCFNVFGLVFTSRKQKPYFDLFNERDQVVLRAHLPGVEAEDLDITIHGDVLTIKWEIRKKPTDACEMNAFDEPQPNRFARSIKLPCLIDSDRVEATCKNGELTIYMPKLRVRRGDHITIAIR